MNMKEIFSEIMLAHFGRLASFRDKYLRFGKPFRNAVRLARVN